MPVTDPQPEERLRVAIHCLRLEAPKAVVDDVAAKANVVLDSLEAAKQEVKRLREALRKNGLDVDEEVP